MSSRKSQIVLGILSLALVLPLGCDRALRDGATIGVTDGLSAGLSQLIEAWVLSLDPQN